MFVTSTIVGPGFTNVQAGATEGGVTIDLGSCAVGQNTCTWGAQGTPGGPLPQSAEVAFQDADGLQTCTISAVNGLPVELIEFSVE